MAMANRLSDVLLEQLSVLKELEQALQDEQKAIVSLNTPMMEALNSQKEQLVNRQRKVAETLRTVMADTATQLGLLTSIPLTDMLQKMPTAMRTQVEPLQQATKQAGSAVSVLANQNREMLERFLGVVNESLGFILRIVNASNTYGARGTYLSNSQTGAVMVNREA